MNQSDNEPRDDRKKRDVKDYALFREGDKDPSTGKLISKLIMSDPYYIVYLDEKLRIEWAVTDDYEDYKAGYSELFGEVVTKVIELEGLSETFRLPEHQLREYRTLLGAAIVTMLEKEKPPLIRSPQKGRHIPER